MAQRSGGEESTDPIGARIPADRPGEQPECGDLLACAAEIARDVFAPNAVAADQARFPLRANYRALAKSGLLGMAVPREYGGRDAPGFVQRTITRTLAASCGVTTFTQAQHHGPCRMIAGCLNDQLKERVLPQLATGKSMAGISFAHLRRPGPPVLRATETEGGYLLDGKAPWVTGWTLIDQLVIGATLPDGRFVYVWVPVSREPYADLFEAGQAPAGHMTASMPLSLCAMSGSATVELTLDRWFVPAAHRMFESDRETMQRNDRNGVLGATAMPLGCADAAIGMITAVAEQRHILQAAEAAQQFRAELAELEAAQTELESRPGDESFFDQAVQVRAWSIDLALRAASGAISAASGAANLITHPAQRLLREAMFYSIQAQTREVMAATLIKLTGGRGDGTSRDAR